MHVVIWDPTGEYWEGSLVDDRMERVLVERGVVALPVDQESMRRNGVGGYAKRSWGAGWPLDFASPRLSCPLTVFVREGASRVDWALRLVPDERVAGAAKEGNAQLQGTLRIVGDPGQDHARVATLSLSEQPIDGAAMRRPLDADGGWTFRGGGGVRPGSDGFYGFGLYGLMPGARAAWAALSFTTAR